MFSATFPTEMQKLAGMLLFRIMQPTQTNKIITYHFAADFMSDYLWIGVGRVGSSTENITKNFWTNRKAKHNRCLMP